MPRRAIPRESISEIPDLAMHFPEAFTGGIGIVFRFGVALGLVGFPVFEVGHVDVDDAVQKPETLEAVVEAGVVDEGNLEPSLDREGQSFQDLRHHVLGRDEVDVVAAFALQIEHQGGETLSRSRSSPDDFWLMSKF